MNIKATTHCQVCGRAIKVVRGWCRQTNRREPMVAHHGYRRPSDGWQTASCFGARWRPYEVARDALEALEPRLEQMARDVRANIARVLAEPPATLRWERTDAWGKVLAFKVLERPEGFVYRDESVYASATYASVYRNGMLQRERTAKALEEDLASVRRRIKEWMAPE